MTRRHEFAVAIENWRHDLNIGTVVRTANAFLAAEVIIVGRRRWNRRGAMVTDRYQHVRHVPSIADLVASADGRTIVAVDNLPGAVPIESVTLPRRSLFLFGQEGSGLTDEARNAADVRLLHIAVRLDSLDQRGRGRGHCHAYVDPSARAACRLRAAQA